MLTLNLNHGGPTVRCLGHRFFFLLEWRFREKSFRHNFEHMFKGWKCQELNKKFEAFAKFLLAYGVKYRRERNDIVGNQWLISGFCYCLLVWYTKQGPLLSLFAFLSECFWTSLFRISFLNTLENLFSFESLILAGIHDLLSRTCCF